MALGCIYLLFDGKDGENAYPAFGPAKTFEFGWVSHIFLRNMLAVSSSNECAAISRGNYTSTHPMHT